MDARRKRPSGSMIQPTACCPGKASGKQSALSFHLNTQGEHDGGNRDVSFLSGLLLVRRERTAETAAKARRVTMQ